MLPSFLFPVGNSAVDSPSAPCCMQISLCWRNSHSTRIRCLCLSLNGGWVIPSLPLVKTQSHVAFSTVVFFAIIWFKAALILRLPILPIPLLMVWMTPNSALKTLHYSRGGIETTRTCDWVLTCNCYWFLACHSHCFFQGLRLTQQTNFAKYHGGGKNWPSFSELHVWIFFIEEYRYTPASGWVYARV